MQKGLFTSVFVRLQAVLRGCAASILGNEDDAADAMQSAFCRLWASPTEAKDEKVAASITYAAVRNTSIDMLRRKPPSAQLDDGLLPEAEPPDDAGELYQEVDRLIEDALPERDRQMLRKREMYGYDFAELADEYGISEANARMIVSRSRKTIRQLYLNRHKT